MQVVPDNRAGAGGTVGIEIVVKTPPDGYNLVIGNIATLAINPALYAKLPYDAVNDFAPITNLGLTPQTLVVSPSESYKTVKEFVAAAKEKPGQINYASLGTGSTSHLTMEMFRSAAGITLNHVPFKGSAQAISDVIGGQIALSFENIVVASPFVKSGRIKALAVTSAKRASALPTVPTMQESGVPGFDFDSWTGYLVPPATAAAVIAKLHADITRTLALPDVREKLVTLGFDLVGGTPDAFATLIRNDLARFGKLVKAAGIKAE